MRLSSAGDPMIYRSRYLDRMLFSPLSHRQGVRSHYAKRAQLRRAEAVSGSAAQPAQAHYPQGQPHVSYQPKQQTAHLGERAAYLSSRELRIIVERCEETIRGGRAQIEDYEAFVICQQELSSRA